jgi:hypothetical protein
MYFTFRGRVTAGGGMSAAAILGMDYGRAQGVDSAAERP